MLKSKEHVVTFFRFPPHCRRYNTQIHLARKGEEEWLYCGWKSTLSLGGEGRLKLSTLHSLKLSYVSCTCTCLERKKASFGWRGWPGRWDSRQKKPKEGARGIRHLELPDTLISEESSRPTWVSQLSTATYTSSARYGAQKSEKVVNANFLFFFFLFQPNQASEPQWQTEEANKQAQGADPCSWFDTRETTRRTYSFMPNCYMYSIPQKRCWEVRISLWSHGMTYGPSLPLGGSSHWLPGRRP